MNLESFTIAQPERREFKRLELKLPIRIRCRCLDGDQTEHDTFTHNISATGVYFKTSLEMVRGDRVRILVTLPYHLTPFYPPPQFHGTAVVVRHESTLDDSWPTKQYGVAARFIESLETVLGDQEAGIKAILWPRLPAGPKR